MATKFSDLIGVNVIEVNPDKKTEAYRQVPSTQLENKVLGLYFS